MGTLKQTPVFFSNLVSVHFLVPHFRLPLTLTQPQRQLSSIQKKGKHTGFVIYCDLTPQSGPTYDSAGALVLPGLSPVVKDNIREAVTPPMKSLLRSPLRSCVYLTVKSIRIYHLKFSPLTLLNVIVILR